MTCLHFPFFGAMTSEESLTSLKRRRASIQGSCTRIRTFVEAITSVTSSVFAQLEERRSKLDQFWSDYKIVQVKLESLEEAETHHREILI